MTFLLPSADGVADEVTRRLPQATIVRYEEGGYRLDEVDFYCLPYMGNGSSIAMIAQLPRLGSCRASAAVSTTSWDLCLTR